MTKKILIVLILTLSACTPAQKAEMQATLGAVMTPVPMVPTARWPGQSDSRPEAWPTPTCSSDPNSFFACPGIVVTPQPAAVTIIVATQQPAPSPLPATPNPTADALRFRSTELALNNMVGQATRDARETQDMALLGAIQTQKVEAREATRQARRDPIEQVADILAPLAALICMVAMLIAGILIASPLVHIARAKSDQESAAALDAHYKARLLETPKGAYWVTDNSVVVPLNQPATPTRFISVNNGNSQGERLISVQDVLDFLVLCVQKGGRETIPSKGTLGLNGDPWQRMKDAVANARTPEGEPMEWVVSDPAGTRFLGGWTCDTALEAIRKGEVVV